MIKSALFSTVICGALIASPVLAAGTSSSAQDNPQTTGQQRSDPSNAGTEAPNQRSTTSGEITSGNSPKGLSFDELDRNSDGKLDEDELNRYGSTAAGNAQSRDTDQGEQMLERYDSDNDGALTEEELKSGNKSRTGMDPDKAEM
ncbi:MAG: EF-hand domain-containing protein [Marinobacter sp.]|nr:EF-hand domain-containing protein [Marinobacter sp.]